MRKFRETAFAGVELMGADFYAEIDFTVTPGRPATWCRMIGTWDPPEPMEWEIDAIRLRLDEPGKLGPAWELTGKQFDLLAEHDAIRRAVEEFDDYAELEA